MADPINPEKLRNIETTEIRTESKVEELDANYIQGAEMLEEPKSGSFLSALQTFVAWVKTMVD